MAKKRKKPEIRFKGFTDVWEQSKVSELIKDIADGPFGSNLKVVHYTDEKEARIIQLSNIGESGWQDENVRYTTFEHAKEIKRSIVAQGELIMAKMMPAGLTIECPNADKMYVLSSDAVRIKLDETLIDTKYFVYMTKCDYFLDQINNDTQGSTRTRTSISKIKRMDIPFPTLQEQERIGLYFQQLDNIITLHQRKYDKLQNIKKSMLEKMFPKNGENTPEIRFNGFTDSWEQRKLSEVANKVNEKNVNFAVNETFTNSAEYGVISQRDFFDHDIFNLENINGYYVVGEDDFVYNPRISATAPVGPINRNKLGRKGVMSPLYTVFKTHDIDITFLEYFFKGNGWHSYMFFNGDTGARFDRFSIKNEVFFDMPIPYPKIEEQKSIGKYLENLDSLIMLHQRKLEKLRNIKASCMKKMFI
ncbi:restriction endonuclease subunit S [Clostridium sporogenes]|uniref:restriction endonuclease subunit S n=1 Tax=Clostridium sporogenes TaxID=1509 RepID=UPI0013D7F37B|nr:restriction endonuclease subunit S [Clostridium sporogenes]NFL76217.1 restriction endonuclease subunit S [Clostridium sporogenes]